MWPYSTLTLPHWTQGACNRFDRRALLVEYGQRHGQPCCVRAQADPAAGNLAGTIQKWRICRLFVPAFNPFSLNEAPFGSANVTGAQLPGLLTHSLYLADDAYMQG